VAERQRTFRQATADVLFSRDKDDRLTRVVDIGLITLISLNVTAVILESVQSIESQWGRWFHLFDAASVAVFTVEYILRVWSAVDNPWREDYRSPVVGRLRFARTWMAMMDLVAILPFYLGFFVQFDLRFLRVLRLLRIFKLTRYSGSMTLLFQVFRREARTVGAAMFVLFLLLVMSSSIAFIVEHGAHHDSDAFSSIPHSMYWAIVTMTTVGYGDVVPVTPLGKILGAVIAIIGLGMVALPAGILASGFSDALQQRREQMEDHVELMLADGELSDDERKELEVLAERMNLSEGDIGEILRAVHHEQQHGRSPAVLTTCPHCGGSLHRSADAPEGA
jgi:voltage-gated potassium channel